MSHLYSPVTEGYEVLFADPFRDKARSILASIDVDGPVDPPFDSSNAEADRDSRAYASPAEMDFAADREWGRRHINV